MTGLWEIVVPEAGTNHVINPSFEENVTDGVTAWVGGGTTGTLAQSDDWAAVGEWSLKMNVTVGGGTGNGAYNDVSISTSPASAVLSAWLKVEAGTTVYFELAERASGVNVQIETEEIVGPAGGLYTVALAAIVNTTPTLRWVARIMTATGTAYIDGVQLEVGDAVTPTTYIDGDQPGCSWAAAPHNSISTRSAYTRAGGRPTNLDDYGVYVTDIDGIGMPPIMHLVDQLALQPGALLRGVRPQQRVIVLNSSIQAASRADLHAKRRALINILKHDFSDPPEPVLLRYTGAGNTLEIAAHYDDGLQFSRTAGFSEATPIRLIAYAPFWHALGNRVAVLDGQADVADADYIMRKTDGVWADLGGGLTGVVRAILRLPDNNILIGGAFTNAGPSSNADYLILYDASTGAYTKPWSTSEPNGTVRALALDSEGRIYIGGEFTAVGAVANTAYIARLTADLGTVASIGTGNGAVYALAGGRGMKIYATGAFTSIGGTSMTRIGVYDTDAESWAAVGTGLNGNGYALAQTPNGDVIAGGAFTQAGGGAIPYAARWNGSAWVALDSLALDDEVYALAADQAGNVYIGGKFDQLGTDTDYSRVAKWNGSALEPLGTGLYPQGYVYALAVTADGTLFVGTSGTYLNALAGTIPPVRYLGMWNGSAWASLDNGVGDTVYALLVDDVDNLIIGHADTGTGQAAGVVTVTNDGTRRVSPVLTITQAGTAHLLYLRNIRTGATLWLDYWMAHEEVFTVSFKAGAVAVTSSVYGPVWNAVLPQSTITGFDLLPGDNEIALYALKVDGLTMTAHLTYERLFWSADGED